MPGEETHQEWTGSLPVLEWGPWSKAGNSSCASSEEGFHFTLCFFLPGVPGSLSHTWPSLVFIEAITSFCARCAWLSWRASKEARILQACSTINGSPGDFSFLFLLLLEHQWVTRSIFIGVNMFLVAPPSSAQVAWWRWPSSVQGRLPGGKVSFKAIQGDLIFCTFPGWTGGCSTSSQWTTCSSWKWPTSCTICPSSTASRLGEKPHTILVNWPARWSLLFIFGFLYWPSISHPRYQRNIILCYATFHPGASRQRLPAVSAAEERGARRTREPGGAKWSSPLDKS